MRKKSDFILRLCLIIGDAVALVLSFAMAYVVRVYMDRSRHLAKSVMVE